MNTPFSSDSLKKLLVKKKTARLAELKKALKTTARITVFRKLRTLSSLTSYSHGGAYYTLHSIARFNQQGLWSCKEALFSKYGTLKNTIREWVNQSKAGYFEKELQKLLQVVVRVPLSNLLREKTIARLKNSGRFLYVSPDPVVQEQQKQAREKEDVFGKPAEPAVLHHELKAAWVLFFSLLDERQKRFYAGIESLRRGRGGDSLVAELFDVDAGTVTRGRRELLSGHVDKDRIRKMGGGRHPLEKKDRTSPKSSLT